MRFWLALIALIPLPALAQTQGAPAQRPEPITAATRYINGEILASPAPAGIPEYAAKLKQLESEFGPASKELQQLAIMADAAVRKADAAKAANQADAAALHEQATVAIARVQQRQQDGLQQYARREQAVVLPVIGKIQNAALRYGTAKKLTDLRFAEGYESLEAMQKAGAIDITADFVAWYAANPAPAAQ